jgi:DNA-binding helix-hairpin-helix protein with protein kinase domain
LRQGYWSYAPHSLIQPGPLTIPLDIVHPELQKCFLRCFNGGHTEPSLRPMPSDWVIALKAARTELVACKRVKNHWYSKTYTKCYWCDRKANLSIDIFSTPATTYKNPAIKRLRNVSTDLKKTIKQWNPRSIAPPQISIANPLQRIKLPTQTITSRIAIQSAMTAINQPQSSISSNRNQTDWSKLGTAAGVLVGVFSLLIFLSRSKVDTGEIELTAVGVFLCLGLVAIGFLWLKVIDRINP